MREASDRIIPGHEGRSESGASTSRAPRRSAWMPKDVATLIPAPGVRSVAASQPQRLGVDDIETPLGSVLLVSDEAGALRALDFQDYEMRMQRLLQVHYGRQPLTRGAAPAQTRAALRDYFAGDIQALRGVAWATAGTLLQRAVWSALVAIPAGETRSYGQLAHELGLPEAARAVGWANGSNPVALVVPCHRVIGANGTLTGYAGGLHRKAWLLRHEGAPCARNASGDLFGPRPPASR